MRLTWETVAVATGGNSTMCSVFPFHLQIREWARASLAWWTAAVHKNSRAEWQRLSAAVSPAAAGASEPFLRPVLSEALVSGGLCHLGSNSIKKVSNTGNLCPSWNRPDVYLDHHRLVVCQSFTIVPFLSPDLRLNPSSSLCLKGDFLLKKNLLGWKRRPRVRHSMNSKVWLGPHNRICWHFLLSFPCGILKLKNNSSFRNLLIMASYTCLIEEKWDILHSLKSMKPPSLILNILP